MAAFEAEMFARTLDNAPRMPRMPRMPRVRMSVPAYPGIIAEVVTGLEEVHVWLR
jgi:hypothetical protein